MPDALYSFVMRLLVPFALLHLAWRARRQPEYLHHVPERLGFYGRAPDAPVIWVHAVSVGETRAAEPLVKALLARHPDHRVLLTHTTPTGRATGLALFGDRVDRAYLPYDLPGAVDRFLDTFRPRAGILMETELWPNLIRRSRWAGTPLYLVNARLSERSARGYARLPGLAREALSNLAGIGAQTPEDARRLEALGAPTVAVMGNLKFDVHPDAAMLRRGDELRSLFGPRRPVLLAASTREGEEPLVLDALGAVPAEVLLVLVPRHPQRFDEVERLIAQRGLRCQRRSSGAAVAADTRVVLGDSMGEMFAYYAASDVAFVGGSLVPTGGQNLIEACAVGTPVLVGPHTFNFAEAAREAVAAGAALRVEDAADLGAAAARLLADPAVRERMREAGLAFARAHGGATQRALSLVEAGLAPAR